jgi:hypothetical protein
MDETADPPTPSSARAQWFTAFKRGFLRGHAAAMVDGSVCACVSPTESEDCQQPARLGFERGIRADTRTAHDLDALAETAYEESTS